MSLRLALRLFSCSVLVGLAGVLAPPTRVAAQATVRVVAWNIRHGRGTDDRVDLQRQAAVLRTLDADVITLQEVDDRTERTGGVDQVAVLAEALGYRGFHGPHRPYQGGFYGNAILTRLPVVSVATHPIPPASGSALAVHEVVVEAAPGVEVVVVSVHLAGTGDERMLQAASLLERYRASALPVVLAGDFNGRPDDPVVRRFGQAWYVAHKGGDPRTYPAGTPDREIDYFVWRSPDAGFRLLGRSHTVMPEPLASDHRPLVGTFRIDDEGGTP